jgi:predicted Fe-Mo cluster-binding NifX family protein
MKIAISSKDGKIDGQIDEVFGRCPFFVIVEIEDDEIKNSNVLKSNVLGQSTGAGVSTSQLVAEKNVDFVITGNIGPRALDVLKQFKIKSYVAKGNIKEAIKDFINNNLEEIK